MLVHWKVIRLRLMEKMNSYMQYSVMEILSPISLSQTVRAHNHHTAVGSACKERMLVSQLSMSQFSLPLHTWRRDPSSSHLLIAFFPLLLTLGISLHCEQASSFGKDTSFLSFHNCVRHGWEHVYEWESTSFAARIIQLPPGSISKALMKYTGGNIWRKDCS